VQPSRNLRGLMKEEASAARPAECENVIPFECELQARVFCAVPQNDIEDRAEKQGHHVTVVILFHFFVAVGALYFDLSH
jgi:hypothetical protein